jgi:peptidoglycan hydrolase-like protein with peptidoglycan-binding domain
VTSSNGDAHRSSGQLARRQRSVRVGLIVTLLSLTVTSIAPQAAATEPPGCAYDEGCPQGTHVQYPYLTTGMMGEDVKALQWLLNARGFYPGTVDGYWGSQTGYAVTNFQRDMFASADGIVGQNTWQALTATVSSGYRSDYVRAVEVLVDKHSDGARDDFNLANDGFMSSSDFATVQAYQRHIDEHIDNVIRTDGRVDKTTWKFFLAHSDRVRADGNGICKQAAWPTVEPFAYSSTVWGFERGAKEVVRRLGQVGGNSKSDWLAYNDFSLEHFGSLPPHSGHQYGMDIDIRPMSKNGDQCTKTVAISTSNYDRARTEIALIETREEINCCGSGGRNHRTTYFNDSTLDGRYAWVEYVSGHDNHFHVGFCMYAYPESSRRC